MMPTYQYRLCFYVPLRIRDFFQREPKERTLKQGVRWTQGRLLTSLVDEHQKRARLITQESGEEKSDDTTP